MAYMKYLKIRMYWAAKAQFPKIADCMNRTILFFLSAAT